MCNNKKKINLLNLNYKEICNLIYSIGEKKYRANQLLNWIYKDYCNDFDKMTNLNQNLIYKLKQISEISPPKIIKQFTCEDKTIKWLMQIENYVIETVYIPENSRNTICISSQAGCKLNCSFCFTGKQNFNKNLLTSEIIGQFWQINYIANKLKKIKPITNVVFMGMGEPLLNFNNVIKSIEIILKILGLSKRRITISTAGISPGILKLSKIFDVSLAISLHASNNKIRNLLMPINKKYNIQSILSSIKVYLTKNKSNRNKITIEYIMLNYINDKIKHAHELAFLLNSLPCKINLIPFNTFKGTIYKRSSLLRINRFKQILINYGIITTIRKTRGDSIQAACGQLSGKI